MEIKIRDEFIKLGQALKLAGVVEEEKAYELDNPYLRDAVNKL